MDKEIIGLLPPDEHVDGWQSSTALVRFADGRMAVEVLCPASASAPARRAPARFRRSNPIFDPATREVIGYEMVQVLAPAMA